MHSPIVIATASVALVLSLSVPTADAFGKYVKLLPNGGDIPDAPACGHLDAAGQDGTNDFGKAYKKFGNTWNKQLCEADSDGDGFTNGQEMGDPCCTWTPTNTGELITDGISHPSDKTKTPTNPLLIAGCSAGGAGAAGTGSKAGGPETINDVLAPVSPTKSPSGGTMPADDDEDDSDESAVISGSPDSVARVSAAALAVCASVLVAFVF